MEEEYNFIIIGAKDCQTLFNNPLQASHTDLLELKRKYNCSIKCIDGLYDRYYKIDNIEYIQDHFSICDNTYFEKDKINILVDFCNYFNENYINNLCTDYGKDYYNNLIKYEDYKIVLLICGCCWDKKLPIVDIYNVINNNIYTPFNPFNIENYLYIMEILQKEENKIPIYVKGLYYNMGTVLWRGCKNDNYISDNVLRELLNIINLNYFTIEEREDIYKFINKTIPWNYLKRDIRVKLAYFIYGNNIIIE